MSGNRRSHAATAHAFISNDAGRNLALIGGLSVYPMIYIGFQHVSTCFSTLLLVFFVPDFAPIQVQPLCTFKAKMNRLILLLGPIAASLGGVGLATAIRWALRQWMEVADSGEAVAKGGVWQWCGGGLGMEGR